MASELLQTISKDEIERARFRSRRMFRMDMEHNLNAAGDERATAIAKNLLSVGDSIEKIVTATGLTREEVEGLRDAD